ncbi:hypothetical protein FB479_106302 [Brevibacillus sp. AG162]|nr:hypothetical protein FB479_106302 [Brevibacillus sp. AG162]
MTLFYLRDLRIKESFFMTKNYLVPYIMRSLPFSFARAI